MDSERTFSSISNASDDTEFYTPLPAGYRKGQCKYVVVIGTVMSGLGKGIFSSSLAKVLQDKGLAVAPIKLEGYLNRDSGTLNPYRHGEVFVLDDGMECDMDLGTYERMLNQNLTRLNFCTSGQIFSRVLEKERRGIVLGRIDANADPRDPGCVKVVMADGRAIYFSRSLIPYPHNAIADGGGPYLHLGTYGYRREFLLQLGTLEPTPLERIEGLEQLRVLEHGYDIAVGLVERAAVGIDTPEDYAAFVTRYTRSLSKVAS